jgi:hypothetical protein
MSEEGKGLMSRWAETLAPQGARIEGRSLMLGERLAGTFSRDGMLTAEAGAFRLPNTIGAWSEDGSKLLNANRLPGPLRFHYGDGSLGARLEGDWLANEAGLLRPMSTEDLLRWQMNPAARNFVFGGKYAG